MELMETKRFELELEWISILAHLSSRLEMRQLESNDASAVSV